MKTKLTLIILIILSMTLVACNKPIETGDTLNNTPTVSDKVLVEVGELTVTEAELNNHLEAYRESVLSNIVESKVIESLAIKNGIEITDETVNKELENYKESVGSEEEFQKLMEDNRTTEEGFKINLKEMIVRRELVEQIGSKLEVTETELAELYNASPETFHMVDVTQYQVETPDEFTRLKTLLQEGKTRDEIVEELGQEKVNVYDMVNIGEQYGQFGTDLVKLNQGDLKEDENNPNVIYKVIEKKDTFDELKDHIYETVKNDRKYTEFETQLQEYKETIEIKFIETK